MCSTPPPITTSWTPAAISAAPKLTACWAEPHWRSTVVAGVSTGSPACSHALRVTLNICSPYCWTQPPITSSTAPGSIPARSITSVKRLPEQLVRVRVLVVALLAMAAPDRRADRLDDDDLTTGIHGSGNLRMLKVGLISVGVDSSVNREIDTVSERIGIAGGGAIASGLACVAAEHGQVVLWARRPDAATAKVERLIEKRGGAGRRQRIGLRRPRLPARCDVRRRGDRRGA